jgi:hypothetical protein
MGTPSTSASAPLPAPDRTSAGSPGPARSTERRCERRPDLLRVPAGHHRPGAGDREAQLQRGPPQRLRARRPVPAAAARSIDPDPLQLAAFLDPRSSPCGGVGRSGNRPSPDWGAGNWSLADLRARIWGTRQECPARKSWPELAHWLRSRMSRGRCVCTYAWGIYRLPRIAGRMDIERVTESGRALSVTARDLGRGSEGWRRCERAG